MNNRVLIRGGGDLATGVAARLHRAGFNILITELSQPMVVRRTVSFAEAVFSGKMKVEEISAQRVDVYDEIKTVHDASQIAVLVDPNLNKLPKYKPAVLVDARMTKRPPEIGIEAAEIVIGLGPGFSAGDNCHVVIETMRGHTLGRVIWQGKALANTGIPDAVGGMSSERVLRSPKSGKIKTFTKIAQHIEKSELIAEVDGLPILSPFKGVLRGLIKNDLEVLEGMKIGDVDPRDDPKYCYTISDKALSIGGGVLEAILSFKHFSFSEERRFRNEGNIE